MVSLLQADAVRKFENAGWAIVESTNKRATCNSARGPDADRRRKYLIGLNPMGARHRAYSQLGRRD